MEIRVVSVSFLEKALCLMNLFKKSFLHLPYRQKLQSTPLPSLLLPDILTLVP